MFWGFLFFWFFLGFFVFLVFWFFGFLGIPFGNPFGVQDTEAGKVTLPCSL